MRIRQPIAALVFSIAFSGQVMACKCGPVRIEKEVDKAYDILIGKIISEKEETLSCSVEYADYSYEADIELSYKGKLSGATKFFGGKGGGSCGGIFHKGYEYLIVIYKCDNGLYTFMCSDYAFVDHASTQVKFLNEHFKKDYKLLRIEFMLPAMGLTLIVLLVGGFLTFNYYKKRLSRRKHGSLSLNSCHSTVDGINY